MSGSVISRGRATPAGPRGAAAALAALALVSLTACGEGDGASDATSANASETHSITGADGVVSEIADPLRIVSLSGDITEIIFALGHGDALVGIDVTTVFPEEAAALPIVGVGRFMAAEAILAQNPTLVIGDDQSGPLTAIDQLRAAGVPVLILPVATTFKGLTDKITTVGQVFGDPEAATELSHKIAGEVEQAVAEVPTDADLRVAYIYTRGPDVVLMFGDGMVSNPVIVAAGAVDAGADSGVVGSIAATTEGIVVAQPDVIIVPQEGFSILGGTDEFLKIPGVAQTPAGETGRIYAYPEGDFLTFGPRVADSIRALVADLYSDS